jgi:hypothetical protein
VVFANFSKAVKTNQETTKAAIVTINSTGINLVRQSLIANCCDCDRFLSSP